MYLWLVVLIVCIAGALGGVVNALMTDNSFILPKKGKNKKKNENKDEDEDEAEIWRAGIVGNVIVSAVAGLISWGSTDPIAKTNIVFRLFESGGTAPAENVSFLTIGSLMTAILVGIAGARWLTSEIDKKIMQKQKETIKSQAERLNK
jgi:hypothetical protein